MALEEYRRKRRFGSTPEPAGTLKPKGRGKSRSASKSAGNRRGGLSFVVQKHDATRLHYDFRLELDGVLKSWAVPKGPSLDPKDKRLAVQVEDHPLEYGEFEGVIPEGEYGGGTVIVWDRGQWTPLGDAAEDYKSGKLKFHLEGEKLHGGWMLVRMPPKAGERSANWLLFKERDEAARPAAEYDIVDQQPHSVASGRSLDEVAEQRDRTWKSKPKATRSKAVPAGLVKAAEKAAQARAQGSAKPAAGRRRSKAASAARHTVQSLPGAARIAMPEWMPIQLARLSKEAPDADRWLHEIKFDGYRLLCFLDSGEVRFMTRGEQDWTDRFAALARAVGKLPVKQAILDGELVALLPGGLTSFQELQTAFRDRRGSELVYYVFDLLYLDGVDIRRAPLETRKELLAQLLEDKGDGRLRYSEHFEGDGPHFFRECCRMGVEGIISKRRDRPYVGGRGSDWLKTKCVQRDEFVIGGFTEPAGSRKGLGSLLVGYHENKQLLYAGRVGTGFSDRLLDELRHRLETIERDSSPFANLKPRRAPRGTHWVQPELVAQVEFSNWTHDKQLRHPSFQGLREDKPASEITREAAVSADGQDSKPRAAAVASGRSKSVRSQLKKAPAAKPGRDASKAATTKSATKKTATKKRAVKKAATNAPRRAAKKRGAVKRTPALQGGSLELLEGLRLTHPERVLYPGYGITKLSLALFYAQIAKWILPHLQGRPVALVRCPEGQNRPCFFQKHGGPSVPPAIRRLPIKEKEKTAQHLIVDDLPGLVGVVQMGVLEIHPWGSRDDDLEHPDRLIFDLDPDPSVAWQRVIESAFEVRDFLDSLGLASFVKTTGGKGLHVVVPIQRRHEWPQAKSFAKAAVEQLARQSPRQYTTNMSKAARGGKIYLDYLRNERGATAVAAYSTRARPGAPVSTPLAWDELTPAVKSDHFNVENLPGRLQQLASDPWADLPLVRQSISAAARKTLGLK